MSNKIEEVKPTDMTSREIDDLAKFKEHGLPGISEALTQQNIEAMITMYLNGSSYTDIAMKLSIKRHFITYTAEKHNFYQMKLDHYETLVKQIKEKTQIASLKGLTLLTDWMGSVENYYQDIIHRYTMTKDKKLMESADFENLKLYMKCLEFVQKSLNPDSDKKAPLSNLIVPPGSTVTKIDDNTIHVGSSPTSQAVDAKLGEVLSALAKLRELRENK